jgi:hypothetical protein
VVCENVGGYALMINPSRSDRLAAFIVDDIASIRASIGLETPTQTIMRQFNGDPDGPVSSEDYLQVDTYADRLFRTDLIDRLAQRGLPLARLEFRLIDADDIDDEELTALQCTARAEYGRLALQLLVNNVMVAGPKTVLATRKMYWTALMRFLVLDAVTRCESKLADVSLDEERLAATRRAELANLRVEIRGEIERVMRRYLEEIPKIVNAATSTESLIAAMSNIDAARRLDLAEMVERVSVKSLDYASLADHVKSFQPIFSADFPAHTSRNSGIISGVIAVIFHAPLAAFSSLRGFAAAWLGSKKLGTAESVELNARLSGIVRSDAGRARLIVDRTLLRFVAQEPRWELARAVRRAAAVLKRLPSYD